MTVNELIAKLQTEYAPKDITIDRVEMIRGHKAIGVRVSKTGYMTEHLRVGDGESETVNPVDEAGIRLYLESMK